MLSGLGIDFHFNEGVDRKKLVELEREHDAVFLGVGLGAIHQLGVAGEQLAGVTNALDFIAGYKSGAILTVPQRVAVIGAGNTAIDAANAARRLGATSVHMIYRRSLEKMSAFTFEYEHAKQEGVQFLWHVQSICVRGSKTVEALGLIRLATADDDSLIPLPDSEFELPVDLVILAIGQATHSAFLAEAGSAAKIAFDSGRIVIDRNTGQTSHPKFFAGGDCTNGGREVVDAVADGKRAGIGIAAWLEVQHGRH
jgi:glutamate synthase (NADPH/NADH) small chain